MNLEELNSNQKKAVLFSRGPLLIVAGAGTGKTKTLINRLIFLLQNKVSPENICAITFTNKAAKEMLERVLKLTTDKNIFKKIFIGTFHSLGVKILKNEAPIFNRNKNFIIFDDNDSFSLIKKIIKDLKIKESPSFFLNSISKIKNGQVHLENFLEDNDKKSNLVLKVFEKYEAELENQNAFDFDDLIEKTVLMFKQKNEILEKYQNKFQYILVDEYQDLNNAQYEMVKLLAQKFKNINVVGDDAQTIYSWRGSNIEIFLNFERDWPEAKIIFLEENYRSTSNILIGAQTIISKNTKQRPKNLIAKNGPGELIKIIETENEESEALFVASQIKKIISEKKYKSIGILYRTNAQSRAIEQALNLESIPYKIFGGIRFYERKEIKDILAGLRFIYNPKDNLSLERIKKIFSQKILNNFFEKTKNAQGKNPTELIDLFLKSTNYLNYLEKNFSNFNDRLENIKELIHFASNF
ncbi:MAG: ATP-dependent helicase, partial [Minisyncoccia bacterium]